MRSAIIIVVIGLSALAARADFTPTTGTNGTLIAIGNFAADPGPRPKVALVPVAEASRSR